jgi:hypothetical protein
MAGAFITFQVFFPSQSVHFRSYDCFTPFSPLHLRTLISHDFNTPKDNIKLFLNHVAVSDSYQLREHDQFYCIITQPLSESFVAFYFKNRIHILNLQTNKLVPSLPFKSSENITVYVDDSTFSPHAIINLQHQLNAYSDTPYVQAYQPIKNIDPITRSYIIRSSIHHNPMIPAPPILPINKLSYSLISVYQEFMHQFLENHSTLSESISHPIQEHIDDEEEGVEDDDEEHDLEDEQDFDDTFDIDDMDNEPIWK